MKRLLAVAVTSFLFSGCAADPDPITIHEDPANWIGLTYDAEARSGHNHPFTFTSDQLASILRGVTVTPRDTMVGFLTGDARPAFSADQTVRLAHHLVEAFKKASPRDVVSFYLTSTDPRQGRLVTSGGLCVRGNRLYVMLANFMTPPSAGPFEGTAYELDAKESPLQPLARYRFLVGFVPGSLRISNQEVDREDPYRQSMDTAKRLVLDLQRLAAPHVEAPARP